MLTRLAPHLVRPVPFLYPLTHPVWERGYVGAGIALYDAMALGAGRDAGLPRHRHLTRRQAHRLMPSLKSGVLIRGGPVLRRPGRRRPAHHGAREDGSALRRQVANRVAAVGFLRQGERVTGVRAKDKVSGREFEIPARQIVNATLVSGPTTPRPWSASVASSTCAPPRASTSSCRATGSTRAPA